MFLEKEAYWVTIRVPLSSPCHKSHRLWIPLTISQLNCDLPILINKPFFFFPKKLETAKKLLPLALALSSANWDIKADGKSRLCLYNPWPLTSLPRPFSNRAINFCQHRPPSEVSAIRCILLSLFMWMMKQLLSFTLRWLYLGGRWCVPGYISCKLWQSGKLTSHPSSKPKPCCCYKEWRLSHLHRSTDG